MIPHSCAKWTRARRWQNGRRRRRLSRRLRGASFSPLAPKPTRVRRRHWRNFAASIGVRSTRISAAAATTVRDAQDLTQSFFQHLLENETLRRASREKGRFRSFLLGALKLCLADEQARRHTLKRGGGVQFISIDELMRRNLHHQPRTSRRCVPLKSLDARWAGVLLERALEKLRSEFDAEGKSETFELLSPFLAGEKPDVSYQDVAQQTWHLVGRGENADPPFAPAIRDRGPPRDHADGGRAA